MFQYKYKSSDLQKFCLESFTIVDVKIIISITVTAFWLLTS